MPGDEMSLVDVSRSTGAQKYYISNVPADADLKTLAATIKARCVCEQAHQQLKEEVGLDHREGRSWTGLHLPVIADRREFLDARESTSECAIDIFESLVRGD
jgi:SRSO17 transposase